MGRAGRTRSSRVGSRQTPDARGAAHRDLEPGDGLAEVRMNRPCQACGKELLFALNPATGATLPLDVMSRSHIYELHDASEDVVASSAAGREVYVSHFLVCP